VRRGRRRQRLLGDPEPLPWLRQRLRGGDTGVLLHNRGHAFTLAEGAPNALEPGKRPLHTLMATLAYEDGRLRYVLGSMGGDAQPQIVVQLLDRLLRGGRPGGGGRAAHRPRPHPRRGGGEVVWAEEDVGPALAELEERGVRVEVVPARDERMGHAHAIALGPGGAVGAGADPRSDGAAILV
jgi:gamma-glutamyltranspeptidase/glutathione hydrolase